MSDNFFELVYLVVKQVPPGRVTTYSAVARFLNNPRGSRAVGWAMRQCPYPNDNVPCHRVIKADGSVGGYGVEGVLKKASLLRKEGIRVRQGRIDLSRYFFKNFSYPGSS
ncbi:MAG TPA: MGMT family protein [Nitrososphaerales archaeon]|nr:MGMT family protein [Nitrososphaerales archaeon]